MLDPEIQRRIDARIGGVENSDLGAFTAEPPEDKPIFDFFDVALAVPRGIGNAAGEAYDLVDTLAFDVLPDTPEGRLFGESNSVVGGVVEGFSQFAAGFVPIAGQLSKVNRVTKGIKGLRGLTTAAERARKIKTGSGRLIAAKRGAVAGVATDLLVFDGHETRLSNLIQDNPNLSNVVTEFLAADEEDSEIEGRLKSALEGLGLGFAVDGLGAAVRGFRSGDGTVAGLKAIRAKRAAEAAGASAKEAEEAGNAAYQKATAAETAEESAQIDTAIDATRSIEEITERLGLTAENVRKAHAAIREKAKPGQDPRVNPRTLIDKDPLTAFHQGLRGTELNLENSPSHDAASLVRGLEDQLENGLLDLDIPDFTAASFGRESFDELDELALQAAADVSNSDPLVVLATLGEGLKPSIEGQRKLRARVHAVPLAQSLVGERLKDVADLVKSGRGSVVAEHEMLQILSTMADTLITTKALGAEFGRNLRSLHKPGREQTVDQLRTIIDQAGGSGKVRDLASKLVEVYEANGVKGVADIAGRKGRGLDLTIEYWMNALLSGPKTQVVNFASNFLVSVYRPFEKIAGGGLGRVLGGGQGASDTLSAGIHELSGLMYAVTDSAKLAWRSLNDSNPILDPQFRKTDALEGAGKNSPTNVDVASLRGKDRASHYLGRFMRFPTTLLSSTDEFFKQVNFRSSLHAELHLSAVKEGIPPERMSEYIADNFKNYLEKGQAVTTGAMYKRVAAELRANGIDQSNPEFRKLLKSGVSERFDSGIAQRALDQARENTFTNELPSGTIGRSLQNTINSHPYLRFFMPFVRTPLNILNFAGQRIDAPGLAAVMTMDKHPGLSKVLAGENRKIIQDALSDDPRRKFEALGRLSVGFGSATYLMNQAANGSLTGRGPTDPEHRRLLESTGWKPYSLLVGDEYVSFQRVDPFATIMGLAADIMTYGQYADIEDQGNAEVLMGAFVSALANNVTQKSYLTGLANVVGVLEDPQRNGPAFVQQFASSFVPNVLNQAEDVTEIHLREVRSLADAFTNKIPGLSSDLPAIRNMLGEKVSKGRSWGADRIALLDFAMPIQVSTVSSEVIENELLELKHAFHPPAKKQRGVDLTEFRNEAGRDLYDVFQELVGTEKIGGLTLRASLTRLFKSASYKSLPLEGLEGEDSPRVRQINTILRRYRHLAMVKLRRDNQELRDAMAVQRQARLGISPDLVQ